MSVSSEELVGVLGKPTSDPAVRALLRALDLAEEAPAIKDGGASDVEAPKHGVAVFFRTAQHLRNTKAGQALPPAAVIVSDVNFSHKGFGGGPGFAGALPRGLSYAEARSAVHQRLGPPAWTSPVVANDRWDFGEQYMTVAFARDGSRVKHVTCGLTWTL